MPARRRMAAWVCITFCWGVVLYKEAVKQSELVKMDRQRLQFVCILERIDLTKLLQSENKFLLYLFLSL